MSGYDRVFGGRGRPVVIQDFRPEIGPDTRIRFAFMAATAVPRRRPCAAAPALVQTDPVRLMIVSYIRFPPLFLLKPEWRRN